MAKKRIITALDIGTAKTCAVIAEASDEGVELLGSGWTASKGLRKGIIVDLAEVVDSLRGVLEEAEKQSGKVAESAFASLGGAYVRGFNACGGSPIEGRSGEVSREDIQRAIDDAVDFRIPENSQIIHVLKRSFRVDGQDGIANPAGMPGQDLAANVHIVLNASTVVSNIVSAVNKVGVVIEGVAIQQLAAAESALSRDERELGAVVLDIGAGTTDIAVYHQGSIFHCESLPMGGDLISKDIAIGLKTSLSEAEGLKRTQVDVSGGDVSDEETVEVTQVGSGDRRRRPRSLLCRIGQARCDEVLEAAAQSVGSLPLDTKGFSGLVLTGGGALLQGLAARAQCIFGLPVRTGLPQGVDCNGHDVRHPAYCTALGLVRYAWELRCRGLDHSCPRPFAAKGPRLSAGRRFKEWIRTRIG